MIAPRTAGSRRLEIIPKIFKEPSMNVFLRNGRAAERERVPVPVTYILDPAHTYPSFEADHMGACRMARQIHRQFRKSRVRQRWLNPGSIDVTVDMSSVDFGMPKLNEHAKSTEILRRGEVPRRLRRQVTKFNGAAPAEAQGKLTSHGVTSLTLTINSSSANRPMSKGSLRRGCVGDLIRSDFGVNFGDKYA